MHHAWLPGFGDAGVAASAAVLFGVHVTNKALYEREHPRTGHRFRCITTYTRSNALAITAELSANTSTG